MARHIGIVAVSPEGAALCYRQIYQHATARAPAGDQPRISLHNIPLPMYIHAVHNDDWHRVASYLGESARILASCGAELCLTPDNAVQHGIHLAEASSPIPWVKMTELVGRAIEADQRECIGLIGTRTVMTSSTYQTHLGMKGIRVLVPDDDGIEDLDRIIFEELIFGRIRDESRGRMLQILHDLGERGCEGVILGCSEAPLMITEQNSPLPLYDAVDLLARGAVEMALQG